MKAPASSEVSPALDSAPDWWCQDARTLLAALKTSTDGLTSAEARARLVQAGANRLASGRGRRVVAELGQRLRNPLLLVLLVAGAAAIATGQGSSAWILGAVIFLSLVLDQAQQAHAEAAAARLNDAVAVWVAVLRDGEERSEDLANLVPGDVVHLGAGSLVPADGVLLAGQNLFVQQSALTGESFPVEKRPGSAPVGATLEQASGALFRGSSVLSGSATLLVCRTGMLTQMGAVAGALEVDRGELAFEHHLRQFGNFILRLTLVLVLLVLFVGGWTGRPWLESFMFALALAVGITPELLPMVVTVSLSRGALRLAAAQVIVKRLPAIHNLGSMDVLCTDKTGTLTEARIELVRHVDVNGGDSAAVLENAFLNARFETGLRTPLEDAVLAHGGVDAGEWRKIDEVPFDFERRRVSVLVDRPAERRLIVKGAPADVLGHCNRRLDGTKPVPWTPEAREQAQQTLEMLERQGFRVLGVAFKPVASTLGDASLKDEEALVFAGFAAFLDPPKKDAGAAIADLATLGVHVKIVTGDSDRVARHVCEALGVRIKGVLLGAEVAAMDDRALVQRAGKANLFCRVDPIQKNRVIRALRARGHVVGYLGDGVNDGPALHSADVGISVDGAAGTARAAADLILLRPGLAVLADAVREGRRTFANTRKYILLGTSSNFGNMASMAAATVLLPFLPMLPVQILLNNLLYDAVSASLPLDRVNPADVTGPQHWDMAQLRRFMFVIGPVSSLFDLATFWVLLAVLNASAAQFQSGWFVESLATQVLAVFIIRTHGPALADRPHPALAWAALGALSIALALPFTPLGAWFGLVALPAAYYAALSLMTVAYLLVLEQVKRRFWHRDHHKPRRRKPVPGI
jgi:Mg2+-importing ATPase